MTASTAVTVSHLTVILSGQSVINDLSFGVPYGSRFGIVGPNGSGKTVLLRTLMNLIPHRGSVVWDPGADIGYVPQKIDADPRLPISGLDLLRAKAHLSRLGVLEMDAAASAAGLTTEILKKRVGSLSGGQMQKVLIAFALLGNPTVLLVDEPTASLDELAEERIYETLFDLQRHRSLTVILVSHDLGIMYSHAELVLSLGGSKPTVGTPRAILTPETLAALYSLPARYFKQALDTSGATGPESSSGDISK